MPKLTEENIKRIRRLNEIADELRDKRLTPIEANLLVQAILDEFAAQDGILSSAAPYEATDQVQEEQEPYERSIDERLARHDIKLDD